MARLIDANVVLAKKLTAGLSDASGNYYGNADVVFADDIENAPTVDAVPVVRCRECKYWGQDVCSCSGDDESFCTNPDGLDNYAHPDDFCSYGERKEGAD